jgi:uncharacterized protein (DUF934 family)
MALIDSCGVETMDEWIYPNAEEGQPQRNVVVPLDAWSDIGRGIEIGRPIGILVGPDTAAERIAPFLNRIDLIVVEFPKFRDGRGFTIARTLRERHGFKGDIRAIGHVLPDQFAALVQCGFSSIVTPADHPPEQWKGLPDPAASSHGAPGQLLHWLVGRGLRANARAKE